MKNEHHSIQDKITTLLVGILALGFVFGGYYGLKFVVKKPTTVDVSPIIDKEEIENIKYNSTQILKSLEKKNKVSIYENGLITPSALIEACKDGGKVPGICGKEIANITKAITTSGEIKEAYLYIKAGVSRDNSPMGSLTQYDSVWFYIDSSSTGGHLLRSEALVNRQTEDGLTELVFDLSKMPFIGLPYSENKKPSIQNLIDLLNSDTGHITGSFVSTLGTGKLYEVNIFYSGGEIKIK